MYMYMHKYVYGKKEKKKKDKKGKKFPGRSTRATRARHIYSSTRTHI